GNTALVSVAALRGATRFRTSAAATPAARSAARAPPAEARRHPAACDRLGATATPEASAASHRGSPATARSPVVGSRLSADGQRLEQRLVISGTAARPERRHERSEWQKTDATPPTTRHSKNFETSRLHRQWDALESAGVRNTPLSGGAETGFNPELGRTREAGWPRSKRISRRI